MCCVCTLLPQDEFACDIFEEVIRYHILCEHELCESEATVSDPEGFSSHLNVEQMNKVRSNLTESQVYASKAW